MDINIAKSIIEKSFNCASKNDILEFDFHGGEVALAFDAIKEICNWIWKKQWNNEYVFHATTNGTLIHGEIKEWFLNNAHRFSLGLSLDGTANMHNINRSNSYSLIDFDFFLASWPYQPVKMTISPQTIGDTDKGIIDIIKKRFNLTANLAYGQVWDGKELRIKYIEALTRLANFYLSNGDFKICNIINVDFATIGKRIIFDKPNYHNKWCGMGVDMVCYDINGISRPCQLFNPSSNTKVATSIDLSNLKEIPVRGCENCILLPSCPSCYGYNYIQTNEIVKTPDELCDFRKIEFLASSYLYGKMLMNPQKYSATKKLNEKQIACIIIGLSEIQKELINDKVLGNLIK